MNLPKQKPFRSRNDLKRNLLKWRSWSLCRHFGGNNESFMEKINKKVSSVRNNTSTISALKKL